MGTCKYLKWRIKKSSIHLYHLHPQLFSSHQCNFLCHLCVCVPKEMHGKNQQQPSQFFLPLRTKKKGICSQISSGNNKSHFNKNEEMRKKGCQIFIKMFAKCKSSEACKVNTCFSILANSPNEICFGGNARFRVYFQGTNCHFWPF